MKNRDYLVIDLEATCDDAGRVPRAQMEIIEIGAVLVDHRTLQPIAEFQTFIQPVRHPVLTEFCISLTSIQPADVEGAPTFRQAIEALRQQFYGGARRPVFCSWGAYDRNQFKQDARFHGVTLPFGPSHINLKQAFSDALGTTKRFGMAGALRRLGIALEGTHHRGIDDARNIAKILPYAGGALPMPPATADRGRKRR